MIRCLAVRGQEFPDLVELDVEADDLHLGLRVDLVVVLRVRPYPDA
jgi:hypothetical protein